MIGSVVVARCCKKQLLQQELHAMAHTRGSSGGKCPSYNIAEIQQAAATRGGVLCEDSGMGGLGKGGGLRAAAWAKRWLEVSYNETRCGRSMLGSWGGDRGGTKGDQKALSPKNVLDPVGWYTGHIWPIRRGGGV